MKKETYFRVDKILIHPFLHFFQEAEHKTPEYYTDHRDFFIDGCYDRLGVKVELINPNYKVSDFVPYPLNITVELRSNDEVVASKDFTVCFAPGVRTMEALVALEIDPEQIDTTHAYEVMVRRLGQKLEPLKSKTICFYEDHNPRDKIKVLEASIVADGTKMRHITFPEINGSDYILLEVENQSLPWDYLPHIEGVAVSSTGNGTSEIGSIGDIDFATNKYSVKFSLSDMNFDKEFQYFEFRVMNRPIGAILFQTNYAEEGEYCGNELAPIRDYTPEKGLKELERRGAPSTSGRQARKKLAAMVGLTDVKRKICEYDNVIHFFQARKKMGLPVQEMPMHALFLGAPGTGKTTVAKLMGALLKDAGMLSRGHVVVKERSTLVGEYIGHTETKVVEALEEAKGGILFIDEAYQLFESNSFNDFGKQVINSLMTALADTTNRDWMLIMAGYTEPMLKMLESNPGLSSRFPKSNRYFFPDYSPEELLEIASRYFKANSYELTQKARQALDAVLSHDYEHRTADFGNARHVMNMIQAEILPAMAGRIAGLPAITAQDLSLVQVSDIPKPAAQEADKKNKRQRPMGFAA